MTSIFPANLCLQEAEDDRRLWIRGFQTDGHCKGLSFEDGWTDHAYDDHARDDESGGYYGD